MIIKTRSQLFQYFRENEATIFKEKSWNIHHRTMVLERPRAQEKCETKQYADLVKMFTRNKPQFKRQFI